MYMSQPAELRPTYLSCRGQPYCTDHYTVRDLPRHAVLCTPFIADTGTDAFLAMTGLKRSSPSPSPAPLRPLIG